MNIVVTGTGYVGLVTAVCLAEKGNRVSCCDIDNKKIQLIKEGVSPIYEPGLTELLNRNLPHMNFTSDCKEIYKDADIIFIGVGTPEKKDGSANLSYVYAAAKEISENLEKDCIIVIKSTVPIGTNDKIECFIRQNLNKNVKIAVVSNPEFLSQGTAVHDTLHASRIVIGAEDAWAAEMLKEVYRDFDAPLLVTNRRSAEMIKYASNDFLALKISYINEIANFCEVVGADIEDVAKGMGYDTRIGNKFLKAGIGYGGSCFPKDTKALSWLASFNDNELKTVKAAIEVNESQKFKLIKKARKYYEDLHGLTAAVLGLTFKPGTDDLREAPSLVNIPILLEDGVKIKAWDPVGIPNYKKIYPDGITYCESIDNALEGTDICFIFTEWEEVKRLKPDDFKRRMRRAIVLDGRNCFSLKEFSGSGVVYDSVGRQTISN